MAQEVLIQISVIICVAAVLTVIARLIRQPPIIAYLFAGILVGPLFLNLVNSSSPSSEIIGIFSHIGVALLLFIVGLSLDFRVLKEVGGSSTVAGFMEILITGIVGAVIAIALGFANTTALYIGAALAFSSTVVVVKILSDKKEIDTLHGRIALGILIVEDFVAGLALMIIPLLQGKSGWETIGKELLFIVVLIIGIFLFSSLVLKRILNYLAQNQETLFLFGIAWALILAALFDYFGFSLEIGALIAGMTLASTKYTLDLGGKIKPLRDFFVVLFFVFFGSQLATKITPILLGQALLFSFFVVIGKPLIVMTILRMFGYKKKTNFLAGCSIAQISEFSLILILLGYNLGHITSEIMSLAVLIAIMTIGMSSYSIYYSHTIFNKISHWLNIFEGKKYRHQENHEKTYDVIVFGYHRMGYRIVQALKELGVSYAVVDYNPKVILSLAKEKVNVMYGDAGDRNFLSEIPLGKAKLIISTVPDESSNRVINEKLKQINSDTIFVATSEHAHLALDLYKEGVDYVLLPHQLGGEYAAHMIKKFGVDKKEYKHAGDKHLRELENGKENSSY